ncbi:hypothetical protein KSP40_PGU006376 [Platanthera guangdongensis]|uniref:Uncharacterized protein n=1 Tax=Platanthera guangdongensis TaxID=2320717 RepID=A0ABR2MMV3_9ASPA
MDWEGAQAVRAAKRREGGDGERCGFCEGRHSEVECEVKRRMKEEWMRRTRGGERKSPGGEVKEEEEPCGMARFRRVGSIGRRSQCQCWKHQCWKKYERNGSALTIRSAAAEVAPADTAAASLVDS